MSFLAQVVAIYFGLILVIAIVGSLAALAVKYKIEPVGGPMLVAFGLLLVTFGGVIGYLIERAGRM